MYVGVCNVTYCMYALTTVGEVFEPVFKSCQQK